MGVPLLFARRHLGLGLADEGGQLVDVEAGKVDACHGGGPHGERGEYETPSSRRR